MCQVCQMCLINQCACGTSGVIMNRIKNFEVILDADDVLLDCNAYALDLLRREKPGSYSIDPVTGWGLLGIPEDERLAFLNERSFYENQPPLPGSQAFLSELCSMANVTIMTAVYPQFMGERIQRLTQLYPDFPMENIIMGKRKEMLQADVLLDDGVHNLLSSGTTLPVLFRQPWNRSVSGICCVNNYDEFLSLIGIMTGLRTEISRVPKVLCIVGPSGSGKHRLADLLCREDDYEQILTCTTASHSGKNTRLSPETFEQYKKSGFFLESTYYCGEQYALPRRDIDAALARGHNAVAVMDISGCMAVHNHYPGQARILYVDRDKKECIRSILLKDGMPLSHQVDRILSIDLEQKNKVLADHIITAEEDFAQAIRFIQDSLG